MRLEQLRAFALAQPHATVVKQWGEHLVFKVAGKMFLVVALDGSLAEGVTVKCTPEEFDILTETDGITQAPHCAKRHWVRVGDLDAVASTELQRLVRRSYDLVVAGLTKRLRRELGLQVER